MNDDSQTPLVGMLDANDAVASVAYRASEVIAIYPITPSSGMAEVCDEWAAQDRPNIWSDVPEVVQLQSEGGALVRSMARCRRVLFAQPLPHLRDSSL